MTTPTVQDVDNVAVNSYNLKPLLRNIVQSLGDGTPLTADAINAALGRVPAGIINTDGDPGLTIFVGTVDPAIDNSPVDGDVWIEPSA